MIETKGYAGFDATSPLKPYAFQRREPRANDVAIDIQYCGICHSDLHTVRSEWGPAKYPLVVGHEIVGKVARVGAGVKKFKVGDTVGVGCMVDSCRGCPSCKEGLEQYCEKGATFTYGGPDKDFGYTQGGYSTKIVVDEAFVVRVPGNLPLERVAPLLCAGITTYSPMRHWKVGKGQKVGIVGLGGLGHMGVKFGAALGAEVTLLSTSPKKKEDAKRLGAHDFVVSSDDAELAKRAGQYDFILDTVSAAHDLGRLANLLKRDGTLVLVGAPEKPVSLHAFSLIAKRRSISGSLIGGLPETQEMLDFCGKHGITSDVEVIQAPYINEAYERMLKSDVRYRFVIDAKSFA
jgi:uncharacterized zinc-type alcohol dehydrogenase-like protein